MFERRDLARLGRAVRATEKVGHLSGPEQYRRGTTTLLRYGKIAAAWNPGDTYVELTPCKAYNDPTATGADNVHAVIYGNYTTAATPAMLAVAVGDIMPYFVLDPNASPVLCQLISPPILTPGTDDNQVLQISGGVAVWDWVKAH